ncbi:3-oxoacyl-ACP synthase [Planotetraspora sp. A-T 1434]|uniref:3-oxoacyl-ACP synthase n=1 Tax=Planotetraspora sp. A-T 1434 TaxID=2979219 RepID=UPI0021BF3C85|nr:3-oxoacyl-ACP synthase [Planotetraspora sp. A-T 1434]MCT9931496.1 3-oxoacyl-ACP synthase [Planotetraspora sp. A-T 1434]
MKLGNDLRIKTVTSWFPPDREAVEDAVAEGKLDAQDVDRLGLSQLPVSARWSAPEMAVAAARDAISRAGWSPSKVGLVLYTWIYHQGHDIWSPPHFVANEVGAPHALSYGVQQGCNAGALALQLAALHLDAEPGLDAALITTGDRFAPPGFDRWTSDYGLGFGDAGTAALLHRGDAGPDDYALRSLATATAAELELMMRHGDDFSPAPLSHNDYIDLRRPKKSYVEAYGKEKFTSIASRLIRKVIVDSVRDAGLRLDDPRIKYVALPRLGAYLLDANYVPVLDEVLKAEALRFGADTGHLGCRDFLATLADLRDRRRSSRATSRW